MPIEKIKKLLRSPRFLICCSLLLLLGVFVLIGYPYSVVLIVTPFLKLWAFLSLYYRTIIFFALICVGAFGLIPLLLFVFSKCGAYMCIVFNATRYGYKVKILRAPFLSVLGVKKRGDLMVSKEDEKYIIHFLDIFYRFSRALTVINGEKYVVSRVSQGSLFSAGRGEKRYGYPNNVKRLGVIRAGEPMLEYDEQKAKSLPDFSDESDTVHVLMLQSVPATARCVGKRYSGTLTSGETLRGMKFYYPAGFVRLMKRS